MEEPRASPRRSAARENDLLRCIDTSLEKFGASIRQTIYWKISILYGSPHEAIIMNPAAFVDVIRTTFRDSAIGVEKFLLNEIKSNFGWFENCKTLEDVLKTLGGQFGLNNASQKIPVRR